MVPTPKYKLTIDTDAGKRLNTIFNDRDWELADQAVKLQEAGFVCEIRRTDNNAKVWPRE